MRDGKGKACLTAQFTNHNRIYSSTHGNKQRRFWGQKIMLLEKMCELMEQTHDVTYLFGRFIFKKPVLRKRNVIHYRHAGHSLPLHAPFPFHTRQWLPFARSSAQAIWPGDS